MNGDGTLEDWHIMPEWIKTNIKYAISISEEAIKEYNPGDKEYIHINAQILAYNIVLGFDEGA